MAKRHMGEGENKLKNVTHGNYFNLSNNQATTHCTVSSYCSRIWFPGGLFCIISSVFYILSITANAYLQKKNLFSSVFQG